MTQRVPLEIACPARSWSGMAMRHFCIAERQWTRLGPTTARWEQAFSYDGGPCETNRVMEFTRTQ